MTVKFRPVLLRLAASTRHHTDSPAVSIIHYREVTTKEPLLTHEEPCKEIRKQIEEVGTQREYAALPEISLNTLSKVLRGKEPPHFKILAHVGFETVVCYRKRIYGAHRVCPR